MTASPLHLDRLIRAGDGPVYRAVGLKADRIVAVSEDPNSLDDLAGPASSPTPAT